MEKGGSGATHECQGDQKTAAADQAGQGGRAGAPHCRTGEKRSRTDDDRVEWLDFIKFGSLLGLLGNQGMCMILLVVFLVICLG